MSRASTFAAAAFSCLSLAARGQPYSLSISGSCEARQYLDGVDFVKQGRTFTGAPYYKADGEEHYIFFDPDCDGSVDGNPRWIIGPLAPSLTAYSDLDQDHACIYDARFDSEDKTQPPHTGRWVMNCDGNLSSQYLVLLPGTDNSTLQDTTQPPQMLVLTGACEQNGALNGLTYEMGGTTADGAPFYKAYGVEEYLYYDPDCDGTGPNGAARWILNGVQPSTSATADLDGDGRCDYHARVDSTQTHEPPGDATWTMYCGTEAGWQGVVVDFQSVTQVVETLTATTTADAVVFSAAPGYGMASMAAVLVPSLLMGMLR